ncbi:ATP-binding protein [Massilia glaciei]|uniref:ATP-binding protein n=1 Tax=Massilia glaciei TaxID=1524097 RepID=UPI001C628FBE|nr:ATP-binding protein [Massilia glaciei]
MRHLEQGDPASQLHRSDIVDSIEVRNQQAIQSKLAYTDFLALLTQDEVARRDQRHFAQRPRETRSAATKPQFDCAHSQSVNHALIAKLGTCRFVEEHAPVRSLGPRVPGKLLFARPLTSINLHH